MGSKDIIRTLDEFGTLQEAYLDSSSVLYLQKTEVWELLARELRLYTIPAVIAELGYKPGSLYLDETPVPKALSTDSALVYQAARNRIAVVSEDKSVLKKAAGHGLSFFNTLMMLNYLVFKKSISPEQYTVYFDRLRSFARYSEYVWEYGRTLQLEVCNIGAEQP